MAGGDVSQIDDAGKTKSHLLDRLMATAQDLPAEQIAEVSDFADYLRLKYARQRPMRGSAQAIFQAIALDGPLEFEKNELDRLLSEIEEMRFMDLDEHDGISA